MARCDLELARSYRETTFDFARNRRIEHYGLIAQQAGAEAPPDAAGDGTRDGAAHPRRRGASGP